MNLKRRCCCPGESGVVARYLECTPVISIPAASNILNATFFLDLGSDVELSPDLELYAGGNASQANIPILLEYVDTFVPKGVKVCFSDNNFVGGNNLDEISALRHRGWRIKSNGLQLTQLQMITGDGVSGTRIILTKPQGGSDDPIQQVVDDGYYFLGGTFSQNPALVSEKTSTDQFGNPVTYFRGYNPRRECSRPEQGRYYGSEDYPRLLFDFTTEFPETIEMTYTFRWRTGSSNPIRTKEVTKTYSKFVAGAGTYPTFESLGSPDVYKNVDGFVSESPEDSDFVLFGYRAIDCTEQITDPDNSNLKREFGVPCMPVKYVSFGSRDTFFTTAGSLNIATGDWGIGGDVNSQVFTDENLSGGNSYFLPHELPFGGTGVLMSDLTIGCGAPPSIPPLPFLETDQGIIDSFGLNASLTPLPFGINDDMSAMSYKGVDQLNSIHTYSIEQAYPEGLYPRVRRGAADNVTIQNLVEGGFVLGVVDFPAIKLDSKNGLISANNMTNPVSGAYHFPTDGMSSGTFRGFARPVSISLST
jgi:hypothetical protein